MPELRKDPIVGRWVIISVERAKRPDEFGKSEPAIHMDPAQCPFCEGNEGQTPPEISAVRSHGSMNAPGWQVRVVPNKFPALLVEGDSDKRGDGMYDLMNGIGAHEVIIESSEHVLSITDLDEDRVRAVMQMYKDRLSDLKQDQRFVYGLVFKNVGERAGASLEHTHSQLIVTPVVPLRVQAEMTRAESYHEFRGRCIFCDMVKQEISSAVRVVMDTPHFLAFAPFASRFPFETHIMPKQHMSHFEQTPDDLLSELSHVLQSCIRKIEDVVGHPAYNYLVHTSPLNVDSLDHYHWHFEIIPQITRVAGFEWGTGFYINPMPPEHAAQYLRDVDGEK